jgi:hypothetical protein
VQSQVQQVYHDCVQITAGELCLTINSEQCVDLVGFITINGVTLYGPQAVPIAGILERIKTLVEDPTYSNSTDHMLCQTLSSSPIYGTCSFCASYDQLHIYEDHIHYCGNALFNCSSLLGPRQNFTIPCVDINNCKIFGCRNNCSGTGSCDQIGLCNCNPGYYGFDCSVLFNDNCFSSPNLPVNCWEIGLSDCRTLDVSIKRDGVVAVKEKYKLDEINSFPVVPCRTVLEVPPCQLCINMNNLTIQGDQLTGCPTIKTVCDSQPFSENKLDCVLLAQTPELICPTPSGPPVMNDTDPNTSRTSNTILLVLATVLAVLFLLGSGYILITKYLGVYLPNPFDTGKPEVYVEDEAPLNIDDEDLEQEDDV